MNKKIGESRWILYLFCFDLVFFIIDDTISLISAFVNIFGNRTMERASFLGTNENVQPLFCTVSRSFDIDYPVVAFRMARISTVHIDLLASMQMIAKKQVCWK